MPWATNPLFKPSTTEAPADVEAAAANSGPSLGPNPDPSLEPSSSAPQEIPTSADEGFKEPTEKFTAHQIFYIFILDGIGAMILSGGINFAIAYGRNFLGPFQSFQSTHRSLNYLAR